MFGAEPSWLQVVAIINRARRHLSSSISWLSNNGWCWWLLVSDCRWLMVGYWMSAICCWFASWFVAPFSNWWLLGIHILSVALHVCFSTGMMLSAMTRMYFCWGIQRPSWRQACIQGNKATMTKATALIYSWVTSCAAEIIKQPLKSWKVIPLSSRSNPISWNHQWY